MFLRNLRFYHVITTDRTDEGEHRDDCFLLTKYFGALLYERDWRAESFNPVVLTFN